MYTDVNHLTLLKKNEHQQDKKIKNKHKFLKHKIQQKPTVFQFFTNRNINGEKIHVLALVFAFLSFYYKSHKREIFVGEIFEEKSLVSLFIINDLG